MGKVEELYTQLEEAVKSGNSDKVTLIREELLLASRNKSIDEGLITSISGKTLEKTMKRAVSEESQLKTSDYAKMVSSLITHTIIESEQTGLDMDEYAIKEMYVLLGDFVNKNENAVENTKKFIKSRYEEFF